MRHNSCAGPRERGDMRSECPGWTEDWPEDWLEEKTGWKRGGRLRRPPHAFRVSLCLEARR